MKHLFLTALLLCCAFAKAQSVDWMTMDEALEAQKSEPKKILVKFYTDWCPNCKWMNEHSFAQPKIAQFINENYYPVAFNAEGTEVVHYKGAVYDNPRATNGRRSSHEFAGMLRVNEYPTLVFFDEQGNIINPVPGRMGPKKLEIYITMLAGSVYKDITTMKRWEEYQANFDFQLQE
jgi:thioredoxin-related protein